MSRYLLVTERPDAWDLDLPGVQVIAARDYLTNPELAGRRRANVFNLCRSYAYQSLGYYVSLLASARGHRPLPSPTTMQDLRTAAVLRIVAEGLDHEIQRALSKLKTDRFELSIYFGRNMAKRYDRLCQALFAHFPAPFLRAELRLTDRWRLESLRPIGHADIPEGHREFVVERARRYFARPAVGKRTSYRYDLAILRDPDEIDAPSDDRALRRFTRAAQAAGIRCFEIDRGDYGRIAEYDALFIRETTSVDHHTFRFARRAEAEGLVVIDDPTSIIRCTNKVFLAELFARHQIPCPRTVIVHRDNRDQARAELGYPMVLKAPDSSFSAGVHKVADDAELARTLTALLDESELVVAQEFVPSAFDWRIGVLGGEVLFVCRYHMVSGSWKIQTAHGQRRRYGSVDTLPVEEAPAEAVALGARAASLVGGGFYGVDIKQVDDRFIVMEVNDNPNLEGGCEDAVLGDELYKRLAAFFLARLDQRGRG